MGVAFALACGVIVVPAVPFAPSNACGTTDDCDQAFPDAGASASCTSGACVSGSAFRPIVVVTVPSTFSGVGGRTFALPDSYLLQQQLAPAGCGNIQDGFTCVFLPPLATIDDGYLNVGNSVSRALWPPNGLRPNMNTTDPTTLPTRAVFHPMWVDPATGHPVLASKLGLPLPDIIATQRSDEGTGRPPLLAPTNGTTPVPGFVFSVMLPQPIAPTDPSAFYALEIVPSDPFVVFPPFVRPADPRQTLDGGAPPGDPLLLDGLGVAPSKPTLAGNFIDLNVANANAFYDFLNASVPPPTQVTPAIEIDQGAGALSLEGWSAYFNDIDGRRVSGNVALHDGTNSITFFEAPNMDPATMNQTLIVAPPPSLDAPSLQVPGAALAGAHTYQPLAPPPLVSGSVRRPDQLTQASAKVMFFADGLVATLLHADGSQANELNYQKVVATDADGNYSTTLPPGTLRAYVVPDDPTLAITVTDAFQVLLGAPTQTGKTLFVNPRTHVQGRVVRADGSPLYAAQVVISPSADLPLESGDPLTAPRESQGMTDVNGMFDVPSDAGEVDVSVRPQDGTRYPWVVITKEIVPTFTGADAGPPSVVTLPTITVPLPVSFPPTTGVLTDSFSNPLPHSIIRAYAFPPPVTTPDGGTVQSRGARLIGATTSDDNGNFQLFVAPPDSE
jgi:hypothetical protein